MLDEIINQYDRFSDSIILELSFKTSITDSVIKGNVEIIIHCTNRAKDYEWEIVRLTFRGILKFRFIEGYNSSVTVISHALLKQENNVIIADFSAIYYNPSLLLEDPNSNFIIYCQKVDYEVLPYTGLS